MANCACDFAVSLPSRNQRQFDFAPRTGKPIHAEDGHYAIDNVPPGSVELYVTAGGYVAVYPHSSSWQVTSDLNTTPGATSTNLVIVQLGSDGAISLANEAGSVDLVVDVMGWYS